MKPPYKIDGETRPVDIHCPLCRRIGSQWQCLTSVDACRITPLPFGCKENCSRRENVLDQLNMRHIYNARKRKAEEWEEES